MSNSMADTIWQIVRYLLIAAGGWATNKGYISGDQVTTIIGAIGTLFVALWGIVVKWRTVPVPASVGDRQNVPVVSSATGAVLDK